MADKTVDGYIGALHPARAPVATRLREIVRAAAPEARESIKWGQPVYESNGPFVALKAFPRWVTLSEALGDRQLFDGGPYPAAEVDQPK